MPNWCAPQVPTGVNVSVMVLQGRKSSPQKSRPPEYGHRRHGVWIAIEYSYKLGQKKEFKFLCVTGWFSQIQSHLCILKQQLDFVTQSDIRYTQTNKHICYYRATS